MANSKKKADTAPVNKFAQDDDLELSVEIPVVTVRFPGVFKGAMVLPSMDFAPTGLVMAEPEEQGAVVKRWLANLGCDKQLQVIEMMPQNKFEQFMKEWGKVSNIDLPKSKG